MVFAQTRMWSLLRREEYSEPFHNEVEPKVCWLATAIFRPENPSGAKVWRTILLHTNQTSLPAPLVLSLEEPTAATLLLFFDNTSPVHGLRQHEAGRDTVGYSRQDSMKGDWAFKKVADCIITMCHCLHFDGENVFPENHYDTRICEASAIALEEN
jgi:hypothetical protein